MVALRISALLLAFVCLTQGLARASAVAPADEYFGPFHESILGVRNDLMKLERDSDSELTHHIRGMDNLEVTIEDWYRHYPRDPWIRGFAGRLIRIYARANAIGEIGCMRAQRFARARRS
jgi:hypothetical protein